MPDKVDESLLVSALRHEDFEMPPKGKLPDSVIADFVKWIESGAADPRVGPATVVRGGIDIEEGRKFWSFQPLRMPPVPNTDDAWPKTDVDRFILAKLAENGLQPSADAEPRMLIRRLYFDLLGLPPTPEEIESFEKSASKNRQAAIETLVDRLLESPHLGEHWGRHWLDVVRFAESSGGGRTLLFNDAWRYRDYVVDALNADMPYNQFIVEQIAGDLLPAASHLDRRRQITATAFLALGPTNYELQDKDVLEMDVIDEQIDTMGRAFLGLTLGCARCHDHKFDPLPTKDYYALAGIFKSTRTLIHENVSKWVDTPLPLSADEEAELAAKQNQLAALDTQIKQAKSELAKLNADVAQATSAPGTPLPLDKLAGIVVDDAGAKKVGEWMHSQFAKSYIGDGYIHDINQDKGKKTLSFVPELPAEGRYEVRFAYTPGTNRATNVPVTVFHADGEKTIVVNERQTPAIDGRLVSLGQFRFELNGQGFVIVANEDTDGHVIADAVQFIPVAELDKEETKEVDAEDAQKKEEAQRVAAELKKLEADRKRLADKGPQRQTTMSVQEHEKIADIQVCIRGSITNLGDVAPRGFVTVATHRETPPIPENESGRRQLAEWLASADNPLTARVMANRIWHWLFGTGLVRTVDNFGSMGERPSHPELLDYLAARFIEEVWSVKKLIREIVLSRVYQQSSDAASANQQSAIGNRQSVDPENRLLSRMNRRRLYAEQIRDSILAVSGQLDPRIGGPNIKPGTTIEYGYVFDDTRRSIYTPVFRNTLLELFEAFDFADPNQVVGRRNTSTGAPQALFLMNSPFVMDQSRHAAQRLLETEAPDAERINLAYRRTLGRPPTEAEQQVAIQFLQRTTSASDSKGGASQTPELEAWTTLVQSLFASIDFRYLR